MSKKIISILFLLCFFNTQVFANTAEIQVSGQNSYKAIRLTPEIYNNANSDLSDILIQDSKGQAVPYFIYTGFENEYESKETYPMELINAYTKNDSFYFDYKLLNEPEKDILSTSIAFSTNHTNFAKDVTVYGSYDNLHWEVVQNDKLYAVDDKSKLDIVFDKPQKYTCYRLELGNNLEKISFDSVNLIYNVRANEKNYFIETLTPSYTLEDRDKTTFINIEGLKNLQLFDITIQTDAMFQRTAQAPLTANKELYNIALNDTSYTDTTLSLDGQIFPDDIYTIAISNNDDKPIDIKGITVRYYAGDVVFQANENEKYTFLFGADSSKTPPVYDIEKYKYEILKNPIDKADISTINYEQKIDPPKQDYKALFNIVVVGIAVLLGGLIVFQLKRKN